MLSVAAEAVREQLLHVGSEWQLSGTSRAAWQGQAEYLHLKPGWPLTILDDWPWAGPVTFLRRSHCIFRAAKPSGRAWVGETTQKRESGPDSRLHRPLGGRGWSSF